MSAIAALLPDGRLHLQHGPIDCLCRTWGEPAEVRRAYGQAAGFFATVLDDLCAELPLLRAALPTPPPTGAVARAMHAACMPFADRFITPMAAVAGAVADAVLAAMIEGRDVARAFVNNGGDIAFHLAPGTSFRCGLLTDISAWAQADVVTADPPGCVVPCPAGQTESPPERTLVSATRARHGPPRSWETDPAPTSRLAPPVSARNERARIASHRSAAVAAPLLDGTFLLTADHPARGLATSGRACKGRGGRSFSLGIADSVTILARTAAQADAAATIIGNAVDLPGHGAVDRRPASEIDPSSDLGDRLVTFDIGALTEQDIDTALDAGTVMADILRRDGKIEGAVLALCGRLRIPHPFLTLQEHR
jgi:ApbE superfamily uncharacterized protein (UPF0280 family)